MEKMTEILSSDLLKNFIGLDFKSYRHDPIHFTNSVYEIVGLYIGDKTYALTNKLENKEYYSMLDPISVLRLSEVSEIKSSLENTSLIDYPVNRKITSVKIVNEHQTVFKNNIPDFDAWITRAIIFYLDNKQEIMFEKENWVYSDRIIPYKGEDMVSKLSDPNEFKKGWDEFNLRGECERQFVEIT